ncbi:MAG: YdeI/OmpD-associated family protein [Anaerolineae bacterium]|nr:YdeI/OmpD-associated family protein [Anaerolineae bacterium]
MDAAFFESQADFRHWLMSNHAAANELWVGFYKKDSGQTGITYAQALDEALCFGWIDGVRKRIDDNRFMNRFTPRKPRSIWSQVNTARAEELIRLGLMQPAGLKAFETRDQEKARQYSYEARNRPLDAQYEQQFRANQQAWDFFQAQAPSYQRAANWWVMSAKKEETRLRRLVTLIGDSAKGQRLAAVTYSPKD